MAGTAPFDNVVSTRSPRRTRYANLLASVLLTVLLNGRSLAAASDDRVEVGQFSAAVPGEKLPAEWEPLVFRNIARQTRYQEECRDVYADYRKAFNRDPPPVSGVALMTDSDNTRESATAYYGDIFFYARP